MSEYQVTAYVNVDPDNFFGGKPRHAIAKVDVFVIKASTPSQVREEMFSIGNRMGCDIHGKTWPSDVRSLSVGDLIEIRSPQGRTPSTVEYLSCDSVGWTDIPEPTNPIVALAGTAATSRPAPKQEDARNEPTPSASSGDLTNPAFEEVDTALRAVLATLSTAREWAHTLTLKAIAIRALELYPQATHLWLEDGDQSMTAVTGTELYAADESLGYDWDDDDDLSDLVRHLDSEQMDEWSCVEVSRNGTSPLWKLDLAVAAKLPMKPDA